MNAIMDLTARVTSFITAIQTTLLKGAIIDKNDEPGKTITPESILTIDPDKFAEKFDGILELEKNNPAESKRSEDDSFAVKSVELVWISSDRPDAAEAAAYAKKICQQLVAWIRNEQTGEFVILLNNHGKFPTPFDWRQSISKILYDNPEQRIELARKLEYIPIQVVLALGAAGNLPRTQRILQMWNAPETDWGKLLNKNSEFIFNSRIKNLEKNMGSITFQSSGTAETLPATVENLLRYDDLLQHCLEVCSVSQSFEYVLKQELKEISCNRIRRENEIAVGDKEPVPPKPLPTTEAEIQKAKEKQQKLGSGDPFQVANAMDLYAITFSGGGIRSATFNLGILEGIAQQNLLQKFDYMSTVSGGGYIGSWLAAWMKRDGSVIKVSNRLCRDKSPDPLGEELKPIKWLRMFSNYFAPEASLMSTDSWTVGITWLRNTLLNQAAIFLMLLSVLFIGNSIFELWVEITPASSSHISDIWVTIISTLLMVPVAYYAGAGMHAYLDETLRYKKIRRYNANKVSAGIIAVALIGAYILSAWFSAEHWIRSSATTMMTSVWEKLLQLKYAAIIAFVCLTGVAISGRYTNEIRKFQETWAIPGVRKYPTLMSWIILVLTGIFATFAGLLSLVAMSVILEYIGSIDSALLKPYINQLQFIFGLPLAFEVFSITVVARMAFLGKYFPDERREWWGRMGALIHRISFLWILIFSAALLGKELMTWLFVHHLRPTLASTGGWVALIGATVKAAFSDKAAGKKDSKGSLSWLDVLGIAGPYLFALGLLILLPGLINPLCELVAPLFQNEKTGDYLSVHQWRLTENLLLAVITGLAAYLLGRQLGVNEFSMHHFYRNRLVRAYMGATRRSTDRQRTANSFTGFDMQDDELLCKLKNEYGYYGPYPVYNTALNASQVTELDRQDRKAESFIFSPLFCGFDFSMVRSSADLTKKSYDYAYRNTAQYAFRDGGPTMGTAMAISGAAVNPNQGYHSSQATAFLLTVFNVQMGRWIGNPRQATWKNSDPRFGLAYILYNLIGRTNTRNDYIALSDGGHFDNMGLYEMVRRKCSFIIVCDCEQDEGFKCEGIANAIRRCRIDFGAEISIPGIGKITERKDRLSAAHYATGDITYAGGTTGKILYIKSSITGDEPVDVTEYASKNPTFPHQTTADQFFDEEQFESYRKLGEHIANKVFRDGEVLKHLSLRGSLAADPG